MPGLHLSPTEIARMRPLITLDSVSCAHGHDGPEVLTDIKLTVRAGECHCITGVTGAGKSTLLLLAAGLGGELTAGSIELGEQVCRALVLQDPHTQLLRRTIGAEVAFALENLGVASELMPGKVRRALQRAGLDLPFNTQVAGLSLGQKYRLMIAAQLVCEPQLLLLDEPWAQLDDAGVASLCALLATLKADGMGLILVEHHADAFAELIDSFWRLQQGRLLSVAAHSFDNQAEPVLEQVISRQPRAAGDRPVFESSGFSLTPTADSRELFQSPDLSLHCGELALVYGGNGCGKSTLLSAIAGCRDDLDIPVTLLGKAPGLGIYGAQLCYLMQRPNRQLFEMTVRAELEYSLKRYQLPLARVDEILALLDITHLAEQSPHKLSYGQQHLVALASLACLKPRVFLMDDPFAGLDSCYSHKVAELIRLLRIEGTALIIASHRPLHLGQSQCWQIQSRRLEVTRHVGQT